MSMNRDNELLLQSGIAAVRSGDKREGARLLAQVVRKEPQSEDAWFWLAAATDQPAEAAACLRRVLTINPNNGRARQALEMLESGQGDNAFNAAAGTEAAPSPPMRPLNTGELLAPPSNLNAAPPPPPFGGLSAAPGPEAAPPPPFGTPSWAQSNQPAARPVMANDPYGNTTSPGVAPAALNPNLPPPPPFTGGGLRLGQLDPNAPAAQAAPVQTGPQIYDPGAELRASLMPNSGVPYNEVATDPAKAVKPKRGGFSLRRNRTPVITPATAAPAVVINNPPRKRRGGLLPLALAIAVLFFAAVLALLFLQPKTTTVSGVEGVTTADPAATTIVVNNATLGSGISGTLPTIGSALNSTPGGVTSGGITGGNAAPTAAGGQLGSTGLPGQVGALTPGSGSGSAPTPVAGTAGSATNPGQVAGTLPPRPAGSTTAAGAGATAAPGGALTPTPARTTLPAVPGGALTPTPRPATIAPVTPGPDGPNLLVTPGGSGANPGGVSNQEGVASPEIVKYVEDTRKYLSYGQFFELAVSEGIVKPFRAGRIKPGVTRINISPIMIPASLVNVSSTASATAASPTAATTPGATTARATTPATTVAPTPEGNPPAATTPAPGGTTAAAGTTAAGTTAASTAGSASPAASNLPPEVQIIVLNGPGGPAAYYWIGNNGIDEISNLTLSLGRTARVIKDQPLPVGAYEVHQVALEYANDIANIANSLDRFYQTGMISYLEEVTNYYEKATRDRDRWNTIVNRGFPFRVIL